MFHVKRLLQRDEHREKETNRHNDHNERTPSQPTPLPHIRKAKGRAPEEVAPEHTIVEPRSSSTGTPKKKLRSTLTGIIERLSKRRIDERNCIVATIQFRSSILRLESLSIIPVKVLRSFFFGVPVELLRGSTIVCSGATSSGARPLALRMWGSGVGCEGVLSLWSLCRLVSFSRCSSR